MRIPLVLFLAALAAPAARAQPPPPDDLVFVAGGPFRNARSNYYGRGVTVAGFAIGRYEVTQREWTEVMGANPSRFPDDRAPVEMVNWYDCIEYCNRRSAREGLKPYYSIDKEHPDPNNHTAVDDVRWTVTINPGANGYRLPTEVEWEYAAGGGQKSKGYTYSGGDTVGAVAWFWQNAGDHELTGAWNWPRIEQNHTRPRPVGGKAPNELGLYDMSGNVREWCWDWYGDLTSDGTLPAGSTSETGRVWKGGGWIGGDFCCAPSFRGSYEASGHGPDQGFRVCRSP